MSSPKVPPRRQLLHSLLVEVFQTEESAIKQCRREAKRENADARASEAMRLLSVQGEHNLRVMRGLAAARGLADAEGGKHIGALFSFMRDLVADRALSAERSWRMTLVGLRHGLDVYDAVRAVALAEGDAELFDWCDGVIAARTPLVEQATAASQFFAAHPRLALARANGTGRRAALRAEALA